MNKLEFNARKNILSKLLERLVGKRLSFAKNRICSENYKILSVFKGLNKIIHKCFSIVVTNSFRKMQLNSISQYKKTLCSLKLTVLLEKIIKTTIASVILRIKANNDKAALVFFKNFKIFYKFLTKALLKFKINDKSFIKEKSQFSTFCLKLNQLAIKTKKQFLIYLSIVIPN
jgi:hypothetical protein